MRTRFGSHIADGVAGENILVEAEDERLLTELVHGLVIQSRQTERYIYLIELLVAAPCVEFSRFALREEQASNEEIRETLQFLHLGRRGFYARLASGQEEGVVEVGDGVFVGEGGGLV